MSKTETDASLGYGASGVEAEPATTPLTLTSYSSKYERRGRCIIINNRNFHPNTGQNVRDGTDVDAENLDKMFMRLGFQVERIDNMTCMDLNIKMREIQNDDHSDAECLVCIVLSHGREGFLYMTDGMTSIDSITSRFKGDKCPTLVGKPKLFFLQACRGSKFDHGVEVEDEDIVDAAPAQIQKIPTEADYLIAYSVVPGYFSWRNNYDGSWFVQALYKVLDAHGDSMDLVHMLTLVASIVSRDFSSCTDTEWTDNMKQVPAIESTLTRLVYFKPKW